MYLTAMLLMGIYKKLDNTDPVKYNEPRRSLACVQQCISPAKYKWKDPISNLEHPSKLDQGVLKKCHSIAESYSAMTGNDLES